MVVVDGAVMGVSVFVVLFSFLDCSRVLLVGVKVGVLFMVLPVVLPVLLLLLLVILLPSSFFFGVVWSDRRWS